MCSPREPFWTSTWHHFLKSDLHMFLDNSTPGGKSCPDTSLPVDATYPGVTPNSDSIHFGVLTWVTY